MFNSLFLATSTSYSLLSCFSIYAHLYEVLWSTKMSSQIYWKRHKLFIHFVLLFKKKIIFVTEIKISQIMIFPIIYFKQFQQLIHWFSKCGYQIQNVLWSFIVQFNLFDEIHCLFSPNYSLKTFRKKWYNCFSIIRLKQLHQIIN